MEKIMAKQLQVTVHVIENEIHLEALALPQLQIIPDEGALVLYGLKLGVAIE